MSNPRFLMCEPTWFDVEYKINTFMEGNIGRVDRDLARRQWNLLYETVLSTGAEVELLEPQPQPDIVFTANAGLVWGRKVIPAKFFNPERQGEELHYRKWFADHGYSIEDVPEGEAFEGEGDVVARSDFLFMGHSSRSTAGAAVKLRETTGREIELLQLNPHAFYHLDTCMASHGYDGSVFYFPEGFTEEGRQTIHNRVAQTLLVPVTLEEALCFACNMILVEDQAIFPNSPPSFADKVKNAGLEPKMVDLGEFLKAGGAAKCLTLWLDRGS